MALHRNGNGGQPSNMMLRTALALAQRGIKVFPCWPNEKPPIPTRGLLEASLGLAVIEMWWHRNPAANVAAATGADSGIWVLDVDVDKHTGEPVGEASLRALEARHGKLPTTVQVISPRGGAHHYFAWPSDREIRNSASRIGPALDTRGSNGYVLAPPSIALGRRYQWSVDSARTIAPAPAWLLDLVSAPRGKPAAAAVQDWPKLIRDGADDGCRTNTIVRLTGHLVRRYVAPRETFELISAFNDARIRPPLSDGEIAMIVSNITARERRKRTGQA